MAVRTFSGLIPGGSYSRFRKIVGLANAARDATQWAEATRRYQEALQIRPNDAGIWKQLGHMLKEDKHIDEAEAAYMRARELRPDDIDLQVQLGHLYVTKGDRSVAARYYQRALADGSTDPHARSFLERTGVEAPPAPAAAGLSVPAIYFDYSDLLEYFRGNRFPTGVQRVQIELFKASLEVAGAMPLRACAYSHAARFWVELDRAQFQALCALAVSPGSHESPEWRNAIAVFLARHDQHPALVMPPGAVLVNVGTSWWMPDYFSLIREAKARYGLRYVPLIYDLIPMITPEHLEPRLAWTFSAWISNVVMHADLLAAISRCTQQDVVAAAKAIRPLPQPPVLMRLDADFTRDLVQPTKAQQQLLLDHHGLVAGKFILFVGTLEARKNHLLVFQAWARLMRKHGAEMMPMLVCVGKPGWKFKQSLEFLDAWPDLAAKVVILSNISDTELTSLYDGCLATIYASFYEGWGLPVTESLCRGKACLTVNHSSLPEAGGAFADYYEADSLSSFIDKLERMIFDVPYRAGREALIAAEFHPRSWRDLLVGLVADISARFAETTPPSALLAPIEAGAIYDFALNPALRSPSRKAAVAEMLRYERSWHLAESWGMFAKELSGRLAFVVPDTFDQADQAFVYLKVRASCKPVTLTVWLGLDNLVHLVLQPEERRIIQLQVPLSPYGSTLETRLLVLRLDVDLMTELSDDAGTRQIGIGLEFFALCALADFETRLKIVERSFAT